MRRNPFAALIFPVWAARFLIRHGRIRLPAASLYYLHSFEYFPAVQRAARRHRAGIVYDAHDLYQHIVPFTELDDFDRLARRLHLWIERRAARHAHAVVTVSDDVAQRFAREFGRNPVVIRNAHDDRLERDAKPDLRTSLGLGSNSFLVVTIGNAKRGQAIETVLDAAAMLPAACHFAFVGLGYERYEEMIQLKGLAGRVHLAGAVPAAHLVPFVRSADAALVAYLDVSPNLAAALPNGLFQGLAAGLPQLYPLLREIATIVERHRAGLPVDLREPATVAEAVRRLRAEMPLRAQLAEGARHAAETVAWHRQEEALGNVVRQVAAGERIG